MKNNLNTLLKNQFKHWSKDTFAVGDFFERLAFYFLTRDKAQKQCWKKIWRYPDFARWYNRSSGINVNCLLPNDDQGIDLVALSNDAHEYFAIQCKYYHNDKKIIYRKDINSFLAAIGRNQIFKGAVLITTNARLSANLEKTIFCTDRYKFMFWDFDVLNRASFSWRALIFDHQFEQQKIPELFPHQQEAIQKVWQGFKTKNRGQLIMACGTGKTRTALEIVQLCIEQKPAQQVKILVAVPSINLVSQTLNEFNVCARIPFSSVVVCSDDSVSKRADEIDILRMPIPVLKTSEQIYKKLTTDCHSHEPIITFSTYNSLPKISQAQYSIAPPLKSKKLNFQFDLIICDEAHRTTSRRQGQHTFFTMVHNDEQIYGHKRLYMTATPKIYEIKDEIQAAQLMRDDIKVISMHDKTVFGTPFFKYSFKQAIEDKRLVNYRLVVMTRDSKSFPSFMMERFKQDFSLKGSRQLTYLTKLLGSFEVAAGDVINKDHSKTFTALRKIICFNQIVGKKAQCPSDFSSPGSFWNHKFAEYIQKYAGVVNPRLKKHHWSWEHIDASTSSYERRKILDWLDRTPTANETRVVSNVACLGEGVDVPALDAVLFLDPKQSTIDIIQAIGRVMRKAPGKTEGYIILPIVCNQGALNQTIREDDPALKQQNIQWKTIIKVVNALAAHDERLSDELMRFKIGGHDSQCAKTKKPRFMEHIDLVYPRTHEQPSLLLKIDVKIRAIIALAGERARSQSDYMSYIGTVAKDIKDKFNTDYRSYQTEIKHLQSAIAHYWKTNCSLEDALTLAMQHLIIQPCIARIFPDTNWMQDNPVVQTLNAMVAKFRDFFTTKIKHDRVWDYFLLFLENQKQTLQNVKNLTTREEQTEQFVVDFFNDFWKHGFPIEQKQYGIVYTPMSVVKWMVQGLDFLIKNELQLPLGLKDDQIKILDPFAGTGSFLIYIARNYGITNLIDFISRKIFGIEIQPVAYYWTWIRLLILLHNSWSTTEQDLSGINLRPNLLWSDTLKLTFLGKNEQACLPLWSELDKAKINFVNRLKTINIIISNPPYKQITSEKMSLREQYPIICKFIKQNWATHPKYKFKACKIYNLATFTLAWTIQMIEKNNFKQGIICFICPNTFFKGKGSPAIREWLNRRFIKIYALNLRGNLRDLQLRGVKEEGENIFGNRSVAGIQIIFLVWHQKSNYKTLGTVKYYDVNRFLTNNDFSTKAKIHFLHEYSLSKLTKNHKFKTLQLNQEGGWLDEIVDYNFFWKTDDIFENSINGLRAGGNNQILFNFDDETLIQNVIRLKTSYEALRTDRQQDRLGEPAILNNFGMTKKIMSSLVKNQVAEVVDVNKITFIHKTPFVLKKCYFSSFYCQSTSSINPYEHNLNSYNLVIPYKSFGDNFTVFCLNHHNYPFESMYFHCVNLYPLLSDSKKDNKLLWEQRYSRFNLTGQFIKFMQYPEHTVTAQTIFWYIYGLFWSSDYRQQLKTFLHNHKPAVCKVKDWQTFSQIATTGQKLGILHADYESLSINLLNRYGANLNLPADCYKVKNINWFKFRNKEGKWTTDKSRIVFNEHIILKHIPSAAYYLKFDGVSAVKHFMTEHKYKYDKKLNIVDDPNKLILVKKNPRYLLEVLLKIIHISIKTERLVLSLPSLNLKDGKNLVSDKWLLNSNN